MTRAGACESGIRYGVQIVNGQVVSAAGGGADVRGHVGPSGAVAVHVQAGGQWANGSGRLSMAHGGRLERPGQQRILPGHVGGAAQRLRRPSGSTPIAAAALQLRA